MFGSATLYDEYFFGYISRKIRHIIDVTKGHFSAQALVSFKKCMPPPLPYFKVNIYPFPLPTSPQYVSLICDPFADPIISLHSRDISPFDCHI